MAGFDGANYGNTFVNLAVKEAVAAERERCAQVVETAFRADFKAKCGHERGMSEAEVFLAAAIRAPHKNGGQT